MIGLVILEGAFRIQQIEVAENREIPTGQVVVRENRERRFITLSRLDEASLSAMKNGPLVVRGWVARIQLEGPIDARLGVFQVAQLAVRDGKVDLDRR